MTINLLFFTVILKRNKVTAEEAIRYEQSKQRHEEYVLKMLQYRHMQ
ncbi:YrzI family small protein [Bacillus testis]|nr:YrzI family small protein [Bacillus testis]